MAVYRSVQTSFWMDAKITDEFTPEDKYFYLYLFTNPHTNLCGCYEVSKKQIANEIGYSTDTVERLLERFQSVHHVIAFDNETKEIFLMNWHKYNWTSSEKFRKPLWNEIQAVKCNIFKHRLEQLFEKEDTVSIPYEYSIDTSVTVTDTVTDSGADTVTEKKIPAWKERFSEFWKLYPKKQGKGAAEKSWEKIKPSEELFGKIMEALKANVKDNPQWHKDGGQYIPNPSTWLNQKRWEDATEWVIYGNHGFAERSFTNKDIEALERRKLGLA